MEVVEVGSIPAEAVIVRLLDGENLRHLACGHGAACFALSGAVHSKAFYEALIEHSADIDATTRHHVAFVVFYGNRSGLVRRVGRRYRPHLERYRLEGLSTSTDAQVESSEFSEDLGAMVRFEPHRVDLPRLYHSMSDCARAILDRFTIPHSLEPCLLFLDPETPTHHCVVGLDDKDPVRSLLANVLTPMSDAFRELSAYWQSRDSLRWHQQEVEESQNIVDSMPTKLLQLTADLERAEARRSGRPKIPDEEMTLLTGLLRAFEGDWQNADLRLSELPGSQRLEKDLKGLAASRRYCVRIAQELALSSEKDDHSEAARNKLQRSLVLSENKRRNRLVQIRKRLREPIERIKDEEFHIASLCQKITRKQADLEKARALLAGIDPAKETLLRAGLAERRAKLRDQQCYSDEVLDAHQPRAFSVVATLNRTGRIGVARQSQDQSHRVRILFLASNPQTTTSLDIEDELRSLEAALRSVRFRDEISLRAGHAVRPDDLIRLLRQEEPTIVHFSGHGSKDGIVLRSETGHSIVSGEAMARLFRDRGVALIVLNACFSDNQAALLKAVVPAVVGTTDALDDEAARRFCTAFYRTLGDGHSLKEAFRDGGDAVALHQLEDVYLAYGNLDETLCGRSPA